MKSGSPTGSGVDYKLALVLSANFTKPPETFPASAALKIKAYDVTKCPSGRGALERKPHLEFEGYTFDLAPKQKAPLSKEARELPVAQDSTGRFIFKTPFGAKFVITRPRLPSLPGYAEISVWSGHASSAPGGPVMSTLDLQFINQGSVLCTSAATAPADREAILLIFQKPSEINLKPPGG